MLVDLGSIPIYQSTNLPIYLVCIETLFRVHIVKQFIGDLGKECLHHINDFSAS